MSGISFILSSKAVLSQKMLLEMKRICLLYLLIIGLSACGGKKTDAISLSGEIKGLGNDTIYLYGADRMYDRMDTLIVEKNKFSAKLSVDTLVSAILLFSNGTEHPLFLDKGNKIHIKGDTTDLSALQINGNRANDELTAFNGELKDSVNLSAEEREAKAERFISEHPSSFVSIYLLNKYFVEVPAPDLQRIKKMTDRMTGELKDRPLMEALLKRIDEEEKVAVGKSASYFRIRNAEGKEISRSNFKDQYILMQFWASWDTLSRQQNAMFRRIYKKEEKNKKFALLGISLDVDKEMWKKAIKADTLKWEQTCDFAGWNGEIVKQFSLQVLPTNILLSPTGRIEAKNMDEEAIEKKLKEIEQQEKERKEREKERAKARKRR